MLPALAAWWRFRKARKKVLREAQRVVQFPSIVRWKEDL